MPTHTESIPRAPIVRVRYLGPTDHKPARLVAIGPSGDRMTLGYDYASDGADGAVKAAMTWAAKVHARSGRELVPTSVCSVDGGPDAYLVAFSWGPVRHEIACTLADDGTMDTAVDCECTCGREWRETVSHEEAASYRRKDGSFSPKGWRALVEWLTDGMECQGEIDAGRL